MSEVDVVVRVVRLPSGTRLHCACDDVGGGAGGRAALAHARYDPATGKVGVAFFRTPVGALRALAKRGAPGRVREYVASRELVALRGADVLPALGANHVRALPHDGGDEVFLNASALLRDVRPEASVSERMTPTQAAARAFALQPRRDTERDRWQHGRPGDSHRARRR
jgi:hypothetical protein